MHRGFRARRPGAHLRYEAQLLLDVTRNLLFRRRREAVSPAQHSPNIPPQPPDNHRPLHIHLRAQTSRSWSKHQHLLAAEPDCIRQPSSSQRTTKSALAVQGTLGVQRKRQICIVTDRNSSFRATDFSKTSQRGSRRKRGMGFSGPL